MHDVELVWGMPACGMVRRLVHHAGGQPAMLRDLNWRGVVVVVGVGCRLFVGEPLLELHTNQV
jgi:hypothetical protein